MDANKIQEMLDSLLHTLNLTGVNNPKYNHVVQIKFIHLDEPKITWHETYPKGDYIDFRWSDDPERNDMYYAVSVDACSEYGIMLTAMKWIEKHF